MVSEWLLSIARCPECHSQLRAEDGGAAQVLRCKSCGAEYRQSATDFLDLRPREQFEEQTKYLDDSLHADARHERVSPPLLGSKIRNDMLRKFLEASASDRILDLGCGSGRTLMWNRDWGARAAGIDIAPYFSEDARRDVDLLLGDLRRLPFSDGTFSAAYSLDVLEHLSPDALRSMLAEANRVLERGGRLFVYTHVRKNARIAVGLRWINALARGLERVGLIDMRQERLRKSDHLNPLRDIPELEAVAAETGFRISRITYYTPIVGGFVENILMRMAERAMTRRAAQRLGSASDYGEAMREARKTARQRIQRKGSTYAALGALSLVMKLDVLLFGRIRSGPFFALLEKTQSVVVPARP
jgi:SAM-dependent methyltransferase